MFFNDIKYLIDFCCFCCNLQKIYLISTDNMIEYCKLDVTFCICKSFFTFTRLVLD